jgi:hypothetical protein
VREQAIVRVIAVLKNVSGIPEIIARLYLAGCQHRAQTHLARLYPIAVLLLRESRPSLNSAAQVILVFQPQLVNRLRCRQGLLRTRNAVLSTQRETAQGKGRKTSNESK